MILTNVQMALSSIRANRIRSFLTMLGVIIGVMSVVMTVSIGEGVKNQVLGQISKLGSNIITIQPGKPGVDNSGKIKNVRLTAPIGTSTLSEQDVAAVAAVPGVVAVSPSAVLTTSVESAETPIYGEGVVTATTYDTKNVLNQSVEFGEFFENPI